jgi:hypothetical protein
VGGWVYGCGGWRLGRELGCVASTIGNRQSTPEEAVGSDIELDSWEWREVLVV